MTSKDIAKLSSIYDRSATSKTTTQGAVDAEIRRTKADEKRIGTTAYRGRAYFWAYEYRHFLRDAPNRIRRAVHQSFLNAGINLSGESKQHLDIIESASLECTHRKRLNTTMTTRKALTHATFRAQPAATNAFIGAQIKLDETIDALQSIRKEMLPCKHWAHAEGTCHVTNDLVDAVNALAKETL